MLSNITIHIDGDSQQVVMGRGMPRSHVVPLIYLTAPVHVIFIFGSANLQEITNGEIHYLQKFQTILTSDKNSVRKRN